MKRTRSIDKVESRAIPSSTPRQWTSRRSRVSISRPRAMPTIPSVITPMMMMSLRRLRLAEQIIQPRPLVAAISSAATTVEKAPARAIRALVRIIGKADGNTTKRKICHSPAPSERAACTRCRRVVQTPATEPLTMIGKAARKSRATFELSPVPSQRISSTR